MHRTFATLASVVLLVALAPRAGAQDRWPISLYRDAMKLADKKDYPKAIEAFKKVAEKAEHPERGNYYAMLSLYQIALCNEATGNVDAAFAAYKELTGKTWADPEIATSEAFLRAQEKVKMNRVDIYMDQLDAAVAKFKQRDWKDQSIPRELLDKKKEVETKIGEIGKDATDGLRASLGRSHPLAREFAASTLSKMADETVVQGLLADLKDEKRPTAQHAGAATCLVYVIQRVREANRLEALAADIAARFDRSSKTFRAGPPAKVPADLQAGVDVVYSGQKEADESAKKELEALNTRAKAVLGALPKALPADGIVESLNKALASTDPEVRLAACLAAGAFGDVRVEEGVVKVLGDAHVLPRAAAASACGLIRSRQAVKPLSDLLMKDEPAEADAGPDAAPGREVPAVAVRRNAAEALGRIGDITGIPALIDGLNDNDDGVRAMSNWSLNQITRRTFKVKVKAGEKEVESPFTPDLSKEARDAVAKLWQGWYDTSKGVDVLVDRYRAIASRWVDYNPVSLFDEEYFLRRAGDRQLTPEDAKAFIEDFKKAIKQVEDDIAAVGTPAVPVLVKYIGGEEQENAEKRDPAVRRFVAGVVARMADDDTAKQLIALANDGSAPAPRRAGAAIALGLLPKPGNPGEVSSALQGLLNVNDSADVRVAAADALGRLGAKDAAAALVAKVGDAEPEVAVAVLRTLARFKAAEAVSAISKMITDGGPKVTDPSKGDKKDEALEFAVVALGEIGSAEGIPGLVVARANARRVITQNAQQAINKIAAADKGAVAKLLEWTTGEKVLENQKLPYLRAAACRALAGLPAEARTDDVTAALVSRIIDREIPKQVCDYDQSVRLAAAEGLVAIGSDKGAAALVRCLRDGGGLPLKGDIRLVAAEGLDKIVTGDKPGKWEPTAGAKMEELLKLWGQFVGNWEAWQAKRAK